MQDLVYLGVAIVGFVLAAAFVPLAELFGRRYGFVDAVSPSKIHAEPKVRCGGIGIVMGFVAGLGLCLLGATMLPGSLPLPDSLARHIGNIQYVGPRLAAIMAGALFLFLVGLLDDRKGLSPPVKLGCQVLSAAPLIWAGITIKFFIPGVLAGSLLTIAWVVLLTNAFNFLDNMDGLSSGVALVAALNFFLVSRGGGEFFMMGMFALLAGSVAGFLIYNFPRARLFMGDSGSLFIGYMMAALSTLVTYYEEGVPTQLPVVAPLIILGVPVFDTGSVLWIRWKNGAPLMKGDLNHFSHRLVALGFSRTEAVLFIYMVALTVGISAVNLRELDWNGAVLALVQVVMVFVIIHFLERAGAQAASRGKDGRR